MRIAYSVSAAFASGGILHTQYAIRNTYHVPELFSAAVCAFILAMSDAYAQLLEATIQHLESLKARGERFVPVSEAALAELNQLKSRPTTGFAPAPRARAAREQLAPAPTSARVAASAPAVGGELAFEQPTPSALGTPPALSPQAKAAAFAELRQRALACAKCPHLVASRTQVVFGVGNIDAELLFVGEAPGADEDRQGEPFVGAAGQLLTKIIQAMGLSRDSVYIANILKCRPDTPGQSSGNRKPTPEETQTCIPFLHEQIALLQPKVMVALGATAVEGLLGKTIGITRLRGNWRIYRGIPLMPTYHPAYLLRNQAPMEKRRVWEDMMQVMEKLGMPVSQKQRQYFLNPAARKTP